MSKTPEQQFVDWESHVFGYGYGTGEPHTLPALKTFFGAMGDDRGAHCYDYAALERAVGPLPAWLLLNTMGHHDIIEYGTSPRYGWLTAKGERLRLFIASKSTDELVALCTEFDSDYIHCYPDACNCGPNGYEAGRKCENQFFY